MKRIIFTAILIALALPLSVFASGDCTCQDADYACRGENQVRDDARDFLDEMYPEVPGWCFKINVDDYYGDYESCDNFLALTTSPLWTCQRIVNRLNYVNNINRQPLPVRCSKWVTIELKHPYVCQHSFQENYGEFTDIEYQAKGFWTPTDGNDCDDHHNY